ncbi:GerAB/ArcD/ProY family transporter [Paenibacillus sinopodophylli]|uniref:GerAB/ArcD/ProY family transporter n=1 Tax=Paenibacillus sinopodophylli TaxID=1837342 RepID=UPI00110CD686|nr:GerAB/ArcD/ProY family transporter [Paenibacillus sinopodophylli]
MDKSLHVIFMYGLTQLGFIFFFYSGDIIASTSEGHWLAIIIGLVLNGAMVWLYMKGLGYFPQQDIISIYTGLGKGAAVLFLLPLIFFLFITNIITIRAFSEAITLIFLANTPLWAIMALIIIISGYIALNGVESIFRTGVLLAILFLPVILFTICISFQNVDFRYFFPIMDEKLTFLTKPPYWHSFSAFAGSFLFLGFIQPYVAYRPRIVMITVAALVPFYFISVYVPLFTFGQSTASTFKFPFIVLMSTIHINWLMFDRITMFLLLCLVTFTMLFISMVLWKLSQVLHRCLPKVKSSYFVIVIAAVNFIGCLFITNWDEIQSLIMWNTMLRFYVLVGIPCSIWLIGIRSRRMIKDEGA